MVLPYFLQFKSQFAIRNSWSEPQSAPCLLFADCIQLLYSLAAKNVINLISVLTIWWHPCVEFSLVLLEEGVCYDQCVLLTKTLLAFAQLHFVLQGQTYLLLQVSLGLLLLHSSPQRWRTRETRDQIANICWIIEKTREFQKNIYFCFIEYAKAFDCVDHNKLWKILQEMGTPDHLTCLLRSLHVKKQQLELNMKQQTGSK